MAGIYIHIPFCASKCLYCDFVSAPTGAHNTGTYVDALLAEEAMRADELRGQTVDTIYIGGGTPTILGAPPLVRILEALRAHYAVDSDAEITVEANPGTVDAALLRALRAAGVNRLSLGVQSFDDNQLKALGRIHTVQEAVEAVAAARGAGFDNISIDLMYGLPGEVSFCLDAALELDIPHLSLYALKLEEGTPLRAAADAGLITVPDDDTQADMYDYAVATLRAHGYRRYEVSNFAKPGFESRHNTGYWQRVPYLGLGAAAHSLIGDTRSANTRDIADYCARVSNGGSPRAETERLSPADIHMELLMLGLRMEEGVDVSGLSLPQTRLDAFIQSGLLQRSGNMLRLTDKGFPVMNSILSELI